MDDEPLRTPGGIVVPVAALTWRFSRSPGAGGQHVNTSSTRAEVVADLSLMEASDTVRARVLETFGTRASAVSSAHRSQLRNRYAALARLAEMLDDAARVDAPRRPTRPTRGSVKRRLAGKQHQASRKSDRRWKPGDD